MASLYISDDGSLLARAEGLIMTKHPGESWTAIPDGEHIDIGILVGPTSGWKAAKESGETTLLLEEAKAAAVKRLAYKKWRAEFFRERLKVPASRIQEIGSMIVTRPRNEQVRGNKSPADS